MIWLSVVPDLEVDKLGLVPLAQMLLVGADGPLPS